MATEILERDGKRPQKNANKIGLKLHLHSSAIHTKIQWREKKAMLKSDTDPTLLYNQTEFTVVL